MPRTSKIGDMRLIKVSIISSPRLDIVDKIMFNESVVKKAAVLNIIKILLSKIKAIIANLPDETLIAKG